MEPETRLSNSLGSPALSVLSNSDHLARGIRKSATNDFRYRQLTAGAPVLAVLGTFSDTRADWFNAGKAQERVLLGACASGLQTSSVNQPIEVPSLRPRLGQILDRDDFPHLVIRMGYGKPSVLTPRRCVQDVLLEHM